MVWLGINEVILLAVNRIKTRAPWKKHSGTGRRTGPGVSRYNHLIMFRWVTLKSKERSWVKKCVPDDWGVHAKWLRSQEWGPDSQGMGARWLRNEYQMWCQRSEYQMDKKLEPGGRVVGSRSPRNGCQMWVPDGWRVNNRWIRSWSQIAKELVPDGWGVGSKNNGAVIHWRSN